MFRLELCMRLLPKECQAHHGRQSEHYASDRRKKKHGDSKKITHPRFQVWRKKARIFLGRPEMSRPTPLSVNKGPVPWTGGPTSRAARELAL